jgi:hypothetical protein
MLYKKSQLGAAMRTGKKREKRERNSSQKSSTAPRI